MTVKDTMWSWVVLALVTFTVFLEIGIVKGFSVLLPVMKDQLATHTWIVGSCISIITGWGYLLGLSAGGLVTKFGPRICLMVSGLLSSVGMIVCACATSVLTLLPGLSLLGFMCLQENIASGIIPKYFEKYFNTANSVYLSGSATAVIIMPILTQSVLEMYGWRGTLVLCSGVCMHSILCGALLKDLQKRESDPLFPSRSNVPSATEVSYAAYILKLWKEIGTTCASLLGNLFFITRALLPGCVVGYTFAGWLIYIVSFALSNGASMKEASIVATLGGIGLISIRISVPFLNKVITYKQIMYMSSFIMAIAIALMTIFDSLAGMTITSFIFCIGLGIHGPMAYIATKDTVMESKYLDAVAWLHLGYGFSSILGGTLTGLMFDLTGSFTVSFLVLSAVSLMTAISLGFEDIWMGIKSRN